MFEEHHQYLCQHCRIPIIGKSLQQFCNNLNDHNNEKHPSESSRWSTLGLSCSVHYTPPEDCNTTGSLPGLLPPDSSLGSMQGPQQKYLKPYGTCQNSRAIDPEFPALTVEDLSFLNDYKVKWL